MSPLNDGDTVSAEFIVSPATGEDLEINGWDNPAATGLSGNVSIRGGIDTTNDDGGRVFVSGASKADTGDGGLGIGGNVEITGGFGGDANAIGGSVILTRGAGSGTGANGVVAIQNADNGYLACLDVSALTDGHKTFTFPNNSGTIALTTDNIVVSGLSTTPSWQETQQIGAVVASWSSVASDRTGTHFIACNAVRLYTSSDSGVTWVERRPAGDADLGWYTVASDSDGSNLLASVYGGRVYTSSDYGVNWTERRPIDDDDYDWWVSASDADGSNLIVGVDSGRLYTSSDSGANWSEIGRASCRERV